jgi:hypothetical protein
LLPSYAKASEDVPVSRLALAPESSFSLSRLLFNEPLVVITDLNVICVTILESKTYPPLIVDGNRVLTFPVTLQRVEAIPGRRP